MPRSDQLRAVTARWPVAVGASVAVHAAAALLLLGLLGRAVAPESKPALQKPTPVEVFRVGSLLPRAGKPAPAALTPMPATRAAVARAAPTHAARPNEAHAEVAQPSQDSLTHSTQPPASADSRPGGDGDQPMQDPAVAGPGAGGAPTGSELPGTVGGADQLDPSLAAEVHARLTRAASDCYPAQARRFRQQGQVPVSFCIGEAGQAAKVAVSTSGLALLDEAARGCVMQRAEPFPTEAAGACFTVKVEFGSAGVHVSR